MNIILQHFDGELRALDMLSMANIQKYAEMVGAEYRLITGKPFRSHLTSPCQKVYMLDEEFDQYDKVLMLDIDMFSPKQNNVDIFKREGIGLYADTQKMLHRKIVNKSPEASIMTPYWGGAIYLMDKQTRQHLRKGLGGDESWMDPFNAPYTFEDEGIMHVLAVKTKFQYDKPYLNRKWCQCSFLPNPQEAGFIHIRTKVTPTGPKRDKMENYQALVDQGIL